MPTIKQLINAMSASFDLHETIGNIIKEYISYKSEAEENLKQEISFNEYHILIVKLLSIVDLLNIKIINYIFQRHEIVCLCGSTKFKDEFMEVAKRYTLAGCIVVMPNAFMHSGDSISTIEKEKLDELHLSKIILANKIVVINKNNYIEESTKKEIEFATSINKPIIYEYPPMPVLT